MSVRLRATVDTNIIVAAQRGQSKSPTVELLDRWKSGEFDLLYSLDILSEYAIKSVELNIERSKIATLLADIRQAGVFITVLRYHERTYPIDPDDVAFLLCATNGDATHLVTYDRHLLDLDHNYDFMICRPIPFLNELRES